MNIFKWNILFFIVNNNYLFSCDCLKMNRNVTLFGSSKSVCINTVLYTWTYNHYHYDLSTIHFKYCMHEDSSCKNNTHHIFIKWNIYFHLTSDVLIVTNEMWELRMIKSIICYMGLMFDLFAVNVFFTSG